MTATAEKINVTSLEYTRIARAASRAAAEEIQKIVDIRDALTPIKFLNRELKGSLAHLKRTERAALKELATMSTKSKGVATVRQATLADKLGVCRRTVTRTLAGLESAGIISREKTRSTSGRQGADVIVFAAYRDHIDGPKQAPETPTETAFQSDKTGASRVTKCHPFFIDRVEPDSDSEQDSYGEYCGMAAEPIEQVVEERPVQGVDYPKAATPVPEFPTVAFAGNDGHEHRNPGRGLSARQSLTVLQGGLAHV